MIKYCKHIKPTVSVLRKKCMGYTTMAGPMYGVIKRYNASYAKKFSMIFSGDIFIFHHRQI